MKLRILRWEIVLDYPGVPSVTTRVLMRGRQGGGVKVRGRDVTMEAKVREEKRCHTLKVKEGATGPEAQAPQEAGNGQETGSPLGPQMAAALPTP